MEFSLESMITFLEELIKFNAACFKIRNDAENKKISFSKANTVAADRETEKLTERLEVSLKSERTQNSVSVDLLKQYLDKIQKIRYNSHYRSFDELNRFIRNVQQEVDEKIKELENDFIKKFAPDKMVREIRKIYSIELNIEKYTCADKMPDGIRLGDVAYTDQNTLGIMPFGADLLHREYPFLTERMKAGEMLRFPYYSRFDENFHFYFQYNETQRAIDDKTQRDMAVEQVRSMAMRLFLTIPPGRARFVMIDPLGSGQVFSLFMPLVNENSSTKKIISDKILTKEAEIEEQMEILQNHIVYVTQNCLLGKYKDLKEYNEISVEPEPYYFVFVMDFAKSFTEKALGLLEQIIRGGPECGIYTILLGDSNYKIQSKDQSQHIYRRIIDYGKTISLTECSHPLFDAPLHINDTKFNNHFFYLNMCRYIGAENLSLIKNTLKEGIGKARPNPFDIHKLNSMCVKSDSKDLFRVPIGIKGGLDVQYLTLGKTGVQHAMILGNIRIGKTNLLQLIVLETLMRYTPDEVELYLIDLKQGLGFKEFSNYRIPHIRAVTTNSDPAYCSNLLEKVSDEFTRRSNLFNEYHINTIEEYHEKVDNKLPRIIVIIDDLRQQFNQSDFYREKAKRHISGLVTLAGYGIHLIMASQTFGNLPINDIYSQIAVRIAFFSDKSEADKLIANDGDIFKTLSISSVGKAIINEDGGVGNHDISFVTAKIEENEKKLISEISKKYSGKYTELPPTRVMTWDIENYTFHPFNQISVSNKSPHMFESLLLGETLTYENTLQISTECNLMIAGSNEDVARTMFAFAILSLCMRYRVKNQRKPNKPFIYLLDCCRQSSHSSLDTVIRMLDESYLKVLPWDKKNEEETADIIQRISENERATSEYLFVFGYENMYMFGSEDEIKELLMNDHNGFYTILWHSSYKYMLEENGDIASYFMHRICYLMDNDEKLHARYHGELDEKDAVYYVRGQNSCAFRPFSEPKNNGKWTEKICKKILS